MLVGAARAEPFEVIKGIEPKPVFLRKPHAADVEPLLFANAVLAITCYDILAVCLVVANALNEVFCAILIKLNEISVVTYNLLAALYNLGNWDLLSSDRAI